MTPPPRLLITDDTPSSLSLLARVLEPHGYEILTASNGRDALPLAARAKPDLVLLDVMMPGHDGFYVCRELKAEAATRDIPVVPLWRCPPQHGPPNQPPPLTFLSISKPLKML